MTGTICRLILTGLLALVASVPLAAPGDLDLAFGTGGRVELNYREPVPLPDGRIAISQMVVGGFEVRMLGPDGQPDTAYGSDGVALVPLGDANESFFPYTAMASPDGALLYLGQIAQGTNGSSALHQAILRLSPTGQPDPAFGDNGIVVLDALPVEVSTVVQLALRTDGRVLAVGTDRDDDSHECAGLRAWVLQLLPDGTPDPGFGVAGWLQVPGLTAICGASLFEVRTDGGILLASFDAMALIRPDGTIDTSFGAAAGLYSTYRPSQTLVLPDGGLLLKLSDETLATTTLLRLTATGEPDVGFGNGGRLELDLSALKTPRSDINEESRALRLSADRRSLLLDVVLWNNDGERLACNAIVRLSLSGAVDPSFGRDGLACIGRGDFLSLRTAVGGGDPYLVGGDWDGSLYLLKLLTDATPSAGAISFQDIRGFYGANPVGASEADATVTVTVVRTGGRNGAISVDYRTVAGGASAGDDFEATNGRLEWADGDDSDRTITVTLRQDDRDEGEEWFFVDGEVVSGDAMWLDDPRRQVNVADDDPTPPGPSVTPGTSSGGGGSASWLAVLTLLGVAMGRRRPRSQGQTVERLVA